MGSYLIDTNVALDYLGEKIPSRWLKFLDGIVDDIPNLSVITKIEMLGQNIEDKDFKIIKKFVASSKIFDLTEEIIETTIQVRKSKRIKIPDAIIAATALAFGFTLLTRNTEDFKGVAGLKISNPWLIA